MGVWIFRFLVKKDLAQDWPHFTQVFWNRQWNFQKCLLFESSFQCIFSWYLFVFTLSSEEECKKTPPVELIRWGVTEVIQVNNFLNLYHLYFNFLAKKSDKTSVKYFFDWLTDLGCALFKTWTYAPAVLIQHIKKTIFSICLIGFIALAWNAKCFAIACVLLLVFVFLQVISRTSGMLISIPDIPIWQIYVVSSAFSKVSI